MIDLVLWSFAVAILPMILALALSMIGGPAASRRSQATRTAPWARSARIRLNPMDSAILDLSHLDRSWSRSRDF